MALTEPDFIERDADKITAEMIAKYEADTGKTLYPAQAERLLIDLWAYREMLVRVAVQEAAKQNLVAFSREPMIDYLGELVDVYRLAAQPATTTLQFSVDEALAIDVLIPAGTRVSASDSIIFVHRYRCGAEGRIAAGQCHGHLYRAGYRWQRLATGAGQSVTR